MTPIKIAFISDLHICLPFQYSSVKKDLILFYEELKQQHITICFILGDITHHGYLFQFQKSIDFIDKQSIPTFFTLGNHDVYHTFHKYDKNIKAYMEHIRIHNDTKELFYEVQIDQLVFLMLNTERAYKNQSYFSHRQITWLKDKLLEYSQDKRIFICNHQPLKNTHFHSDVMHIGAQDKILKDMLFQYPNLHFISGHLHNKVVHLIHNEYGTLIDVPAFHPMRWKDKRGYGWVITIDDEVSYELYHFLSR